MQIAESLRSLGSDVDLVDVDWARGHSARLAGRLVRRGRRGSFLRRAGAVTGPADLLLVVKGVSSVLDGAQIGELRGRLRPGRTALWLFDPLSRARVDVEDAAFRVFDIVFCHDARDVSTLRERATRAIYLPPGAFRVAESRSRQKDLDLVFVGHHLHSPRRTALIEALMREADARAWRVLVAGQGWLDCVRSKRWSLACRPMSIKGELSSEHAFALYQRAHVALNEHAEDAAGAWNARFFQIAASGTCQLSDRRPEAPPLFQPDVHFTAYNDEAELVDAIAGLLADEARRSSLAQRALEEVRAHHTLAKRAAALMGACGLVGER